MGKDLDWSKTGTVEAMARWIRDNSGAMAVVVVRVDDAVLAADGKLEPQDAQDLVIDRVIDLARLLKAERQAKKKSARLKLDPVRE